MDRVGVLKLLCAIGFLAVLASNIWTISRWNESRGVYDDVCYLRQAHLFQRFGLAGLETDISTMEEGVVPRLPTAVLSTGLMIVGMLSVSSGLVLDTVTRGRREMKLLAYLSQPAINKK